MGLRPTQGNEKRLGPASTLYGTVTLSLSSRPERTRISCHAELATSTYAPFHKERRMRLAKANKFDRKSGGAERRDLRFPRKLPGDVFRPSVPGFLPRSSGRRRVCAFLLSKGA
jgi:hypothetical protein